jgi:molybdopterin molybdotransferase
MGFDSVKVFRKPVVAVIPTGDELVSHKKAGEVPPSGTVLETNGLMAALYVEKWGGIPR